MKHYVLALLGGMLLFGTEAMFAQEHAAAVKKGERIIKVLCHKEKLPSFDASLTTLMEQIAQSGACTKLNRRQRQAVAYAIQAGGRSEEKHQHIHVGKEEKCPVCGMYVSKYPKWATFMRVGERNYYFDGVKDMMKYYIFDGDFPYARKAISKMMVSDYYTLEAIGAKEAFYVLDSDVYGPMGHELIPFKSREKAEVFLAEHHGKRLVRFEEITDRMIMALDGIAY
jgi:nitrous oxide reductase accessory protein NosL